MKLELGKEPLNVVCGAILKLLEKNELLTLSVYHKELWSATVFFAYSKDFTLYFISDPKTIHGKMLSRNKNVSGTIYSNNSVWGSNLQGIQFTGSAKRVGLLQVASAGKIYLDRFPVATKFIESPQIFLSSKIQSRIYQIKPRVIQIYDEVTFGEDQPTRRVCF